MTQTKGDTFIEILELTNNELELIKMLRGRIRFGEVTIMIRDGQPMRVIRTTEITDLAKA